MKTKSFLSFIVLFMVTSTIFAQNASIQKGISNGINNYEFYENKGKPVVILSHPYGTDLTVWNEVRPLLQKHFSVLVYDLRGHGKSAVPDVPYTVDVFGNDVVTMMDKLKIKEAYFCGVSISGMIGQWLAINKPDKIKKAVISNSAYAFKDEATQTWLKNMQQEILTKGTSSQTNTYMDFYFSKNFAQKHPERVAEVRNKFENTSKIGMANALYTPLNIDFTNDLPNISIPIFIIQGKQDLHFDKTSALKMNELIPYSTLMILNGAHLTCIENPREYAEAIKDFFGPLYKEQYSKDF